MDLKNEKKFHCKHCGKLFSQKNYLIQHESIHLPRTEQKLYKCPLCDKGCRLRPNLKKHLRKHVTTKEELEKLWDVHKFDLPMLRETTLIDKEQLNKQQAMYENKIKALENKYKAVVMKMKAEIESEKEEKIKQQEVYEGKLKLLEENCNTLEEKKKNLHWCSQCDKQAQYSTCLLFLYLFNCTTITLFP
jgi:hypothetical protein